MAMSFFGQFLGSFILAVMIKFTLVRNIFIFAAVICGLSIVVIITLLQDSLSDKATSAGKTSVIVCKSIMQLAPHKITIFRDLKNLKLCFSAISIHSAYPTSRKIS